MKPVRLILLPALASEPAPFLVIGQGGFVLERGSLTVEGERPEPMRTVAVVPGGDVVVRWLELPVGGLAQQRTAAAWMLREELASTADRLTVALGPVVAAGAPRMVAVVSASLLEAWTDYLDALGAPADVLLPDMLTLEAPFEEEALAAVAFGPGVALRGRHFAATVQPDLVDLIADGREVIAVDESAAVERALVAAALSPVLNLRPERKVAVAGSWRRTAALAAAVGLSPLVLVLAQATRDELAVGRIERETTAAIARAAPELAAAPDPVAALLQQVRVAPPPGGVAATAAALFAAVEGVEGAELDILVSDPGEGMKATLSHPDYKDVEVMQTAMAGAGLVIEETGVSEEGGRIVSDITIGGAR